MGLSVTFVSGPRKSGKTAAVRLMIERLYKTKPHYLRLNAQTDRPGRSVSLHNPKQDSVLASAKWIDYDQDRVFEMLTETLTSIYKADRFGSVVIEADADASLRFAYPYDHRIFVMPPPTAVDVVFRNPQRAAVELQRVLDDTAVFASEIFGLFEDSKTEDVDPSEERADLSDTQMRNFLYSPLGDELATRIQLQQDYHGLVESDLILVNTGLGTTSPETRICLRRIEQLLERTGGLAGRTSQLFQFDPFQKDGKIERKLLAALRPMCVSGT